ncbi:HNH endonuclease [Dolichospermum flos-aquae]|uniref:HNH endonuclease n=1 Tax=Dolichospermum flos-aquae LEGE 04289 TaxID=1828708 RepID=A0ACC5Q3A9_DOLFA|nr:HNH endonuclease signature motif containing protein [Dolichospermum flos-aquae]MBE9219137.1 HNH endonuclease [Dolichospermum flos-aquae LEGE 04289]
MVSEPTRRLIRKRAKFLCEYCHSPEYLSPDRFTIDHIMPQSLGGSDELDNKERLIEQLRKLGVEPDSDNLTL